MWRASRAGAAWRRPTAKIRYLVSRLGIAAVRGFQGDGNFRDKRHVIATLKHFVGHGQPESGMNCAPANVSMRVLRETFLSPSGKPCARRAPSR